MRMLTEDQAMTALCLWEALLNIEREASKHSEKIGELWDGYGSFAMRQAMIDMTADCDTAWQAAEALGVAGDAFDFDWCPKFIQASIDSGALAEALRQGSAALAKTPGLAAFLSKIRDGSL